MAGNPIDGFSVTKDDFKFIGEGLQRPECILAERTARCGRPMRAAAW